MELLWLVLTMLLAPIVTAFLFLGGCALLGRWLD